MSQRKEVVRSFMLISHLGLTVMVPIFMCVIAGIFIDKKFGTYFVIPLFILGAMAGFRNVYISVKAIYDNEEESGHDRRK